MTTRMLIDARHREETRVAVVKGNRIEEFDFESAERKQLKGNIYLAKVTRVEPSLQAAFIDYGGNRHGFLAFSEIHPDYYQIPKEDREALLREEAEHAAEEAALRAEQDADDDDADEHDDDGDDDAPRGEIVEVERGEDEGTSSGADADEHDDAEGEPVEGDAPAPRRGRGRGNDDQVEALRQRRMNLRRRYKIQDVIHRRQVLLVQVVKEERGNKGAALTTYLSLAGRYCVLMPNTSHGGGISRKISNAGDRKRLKTIMADMKLPPSMGCIVRTAGLQRTRTEIKRDFDYLARLWDGIREDTLKSAAPALVHGDSDLIKRAVRDIYNKDIDEVIVEGEEGYRHAKDFMRLLMPSHARRVKQYADAVPLFQRAHVEDQLAAMYNPVVQLKSGGYLVINPTEALVSIDINSGRSTREHNIEQTATATNLEAAQEIARQLRLRDMAGLVVIDFIDMDNGSNVRKVEKAMKEALKDDRARIQVGRISSFGLMEMSRQRLRTGVLEASTRTCPHCEGTGLVRTAASAGLSALRLIEDEAARGRASCITLRASQEAAFYVLNRKRGDIAEIEDRYGVMVEVLADGEGEGARMTVEASGPPPAHAPRIEPLIVEEDEDDLVEEEEIDEADDEVAADEPERAPREAGGEREREGDGRKRRRRRGRRGRRPEGEGEGADGSEQADAGDDGEPDAEAGAEGEADDARDEFAGEQPQAEAGEGGRRRRGRRGRRGGRRGDAGGSEGNGVEFASEQAVDGDAATASQDRHDEAADVDVDSDDAVELAEPLVDAADAGPIVTPLDIPTREEDAAPKPRRRPRARRGAETAASETAEVQAAPIAETADAVPTTDAASEPAGDPAADEAPAKPRRTRRKAVADAADAPAGEAEEAPPPRRRTSRRKAAEPAEEAAEPSTPAAQLAANDVAEEASPVAGQDGTLPDAAPDAKAAPATAAEAPAGDEASGESPRRGWWQRTFGA